MFEDLRGDRAPRLTARDNQALERIAGALAKSADAQKVREVAFHLADWAADAACILALHLFPERFTKGESADGVESFLVHAPNRIATVALKGFAPADIFGVADFRAEPATQG